MAHKGKAWEFLFRRDYFIREGIHNWNSWPDRIRLQMGTHVTPNTGTIVSGNYYSTPGVVNDTIAQVWWDTVVATTTGTVECRLVYKLTFDAGWADYQLFLGPLSAPTAKSQLMTGAVTFFPQTQLGQWVSIPPATGIPRNINCVLWPRVWSDP